MIYYIIVFLLLISILLALWSLKRQGELQELKTVKKDLKKSRIIFAYSSSSEVSK
jgi:hypothetical protein